MRHAGVTEEQIAEAKRWDLLSYLQAYEPGELKKSGPREYRTRSHDSLVISNGKWHWCSRNMGGRTALDYLIKVRGQDFVSAVETLCGGGASPFLSQPADLPPPKPFELPEPNRYATKVMGYLQGRGIDGGIISRCLRDGSLYESFRYHNCVFVGRDMEGKARFACLRGTFGDFKMDVPVSDKRFNFCLGKRRYGGSYALQNEDVIAWHSTICQVNDCGPVEIPYRAILPQGVENMICPGRHLSADGVAIDWLDLIPQCVGTGQAAGVAAAVAVADGATAHGVDIKKVQDILVDQDVPLPRNAKFEAKDPTYKECVEAHQYGLYTDKAKLAKEQREKGQPLDLEFQEDINKPNVERKLH